MSERTITPEIIEVALTPDERLAWSDKEGDILMEIENVESEYKEQRTNYLETMRRLKRELSEAQRVIRNRTVLKSVECYNEYNFDNGIVYTRRADNDEIVTHRLMSEKDRQLSLLTPAPTAEKVNPPKRNKKVAGAPDTIKPMMKPDGSLLLTGDGQHRIVAPDIVEELKAAGYTLKTLTIDNLAELWINQSRPYTHETKEISFAPKRGSKRKESAA
jgi:hypothetical protein